MTTGRAVVLDRPGGTFRVETFRLPDLQPGTVLLRQELAGCCGTDAHAYLGQWRSEFPVILGHENVGVVEALGPGGARDYQGRDLRLGDRVVARTSACGVCHECRVLRLRRRCRNIGVRYGFSDPHRAPFGGGFGEYLYLGSPRTTFIMKVALPASIAALHEPLGVAAHAIRRAPPRLGSTVVIQGSGVIGLLTLGLARLAGAARAIVVGGPPERLALARELGAAVTLDVGGVPSPEERVRLVLAETPHGLGADVVYGCVGKAPAFAEGIGYLRDGEGRFLEVGLAGDDGAVPFNPSTQLVAKNATFIGALGMTDEDSVTAVSVMEAGLLPLSALVTHQLPLERAADAIATLNGDYRLDGRTAVKIAIAPHGPVA